MYESAGLSLENVDIMYKSPTVKPWTSSRWAPPGYASRTAAVEEKRESTPTATDMEMGAAGADMKGTGPVAEEERAENA